MALFLQTEIEKASKLGFTEGAKGLPAPEATDPDLNESMFYAKAVSQLNKTGEAITPKISAQGKRVAEVGSKLESVRAVIDSLHNRTSLEAQINGRLQQSLGAMVVAKKNQLLRDAELNAFKLGNNLYHPASYPTDMAKHLSWVVITLAIETIVNAAFFAGANSLVFGAVIAFAVSVVNLGIAFIGGIFFRGKNSVHGATKFQGWLIFSIAWILLGGINLFTACVRSASAELLAKELGEDPIAAIFSNPIQATSLALDNIAGILQGHFPFSDLSGLILLFVGLLAAVIGMWKGYAADDPYPKYGALTRSSVEADKTYLALELSLKSDAQEVADKPIKEIVDSRQTINSLKQQIGTIRKDATDLKNDWQQSVAQLTHEFESIVDVYRKSVKAVKPNPPPAYFGEPVTLPENQSISNSLGELDSQTNKAQSEIDVFSVEALPFLAESEQTLNNERSTLLGKIVVDHIEQITKTARQSI
jgi:hypothetical protein